jgi:hypothetical protein
MGLFDKITGKARREEEARLAALAELEELAQIELRKAERKAKAEAKKAEKAAKQAKAADDANSPKAIATAKKEPWVTVLSMEIDPNDPSNGAFELDWNDIFVAQLIKAGYQGKTDQDIVDNWFRAVCSNVVMENFEQAMADPSNRPTNRRDLGNGRTEIS